MDYQCGIVKWFSDDKGYGFIEALDGRGDVFVHQKTIRLDGFRTLVEGQQVWYRAADTERGRKALDVYVSDPRTAQSEPAAARFRPGKS